MAENRGTKFGVPKNELFFYDEETRELRPLVDEDGVIGVKLFNSGVVLPVEIRNNRREFLFTYTTNLGANAVYTSSVYDGMSNSKVSGFISPSFDGKLYIQQSDDQVAWYTTSQTDITATLTDTISSVVYNKATLFEQNITGRYFRIIFVNGTTAQTRFALSAYVSN